MLGFILNRLRNGRKAALREEERRLIVGGGSLPGDFVECTTCGERWEYDPQQPRETSFPVRWGQWKDHVRLMHPDA